MPDSNEDRNRKVIREKTALLPVEDLRPGMKLMRPVVDESTGQILLEEGLELDENKIRLLVKHGVSEVWVQYTEEEDLSDILEKLDRVNRDKLEVPISHQDEYSQPREEHQPEQEEELPSREKGSIEKILDEIEEVDSKSALYLWETPAFVVKEPPNKELAAEREKLVGIAREAAEEEKEVEEKAKQQEEVRKQVHEVETPDEYREKEKEIEEKQEQMVEQSKEIIERVSEKEEIDYDEVSTASDFLINEYVQNKDVLLGLRQLKATGTYLYDHAVLSTIFSIAIGTALGFKRVQLDVLAVAALLHDIGMVKVPRAIIVKKGPLSIDELLTVRKHPKFGLEIISKNPQISRLSIYTAYQHHERENGNGYPEGRKSLEIHLFSKIVAVADVYAALIESRPYREPYVPHAAIKQIVMSSGVLFDPVVVRALVSVVGLYPVGSYVYLNTGEIVKVVRANPKAPLRPIVLIVANENWKPVDVDYFIDLTRRTDLYITAPLNLEETRRIKEILKAR